MGYKPHTENNRYGTNRKLPTCRRCGYTHYNFEPCSDLRDDPALLEKPHMRHLFRDVAGQNGSPQRIERTTVPDGFRERTDLLETVTAAPGNRFYQVRGI